MTTAESTSNLSIQTAPMSGSLNSAHLARKRRREKMRGGNTTNIIKSVDAVPDESLSCTSKESQAKGILPPKKRKYSVDHSDSSISSSNIDTKSKKKVTLRSKSQTKSMRPGVSTQKRYDPDVPMTKEEASAWRREARRVRNRESAAASRRKIRDKIEVLEEEVEEWKAKYEAVMRKLQEVSESSKVAQDQNGSWVAGPCVSPPLHPKESPVNVLPSISVNSTSYPGRSDGNDQHHLIETILRPATKIAGADLFPETTPDICLSHPTIDVLPAVVNCVSSNEESSKDDGLSEDDELENFCFDTFLTGNEPDFLAVL